jgi:hypothetical protein
VTARQAVGDAHINEHRSRRHETACREALNGAQLVERCAAAVTLVGERRIGIAVADDDVAAREGGADHLDDRVVARGVVEQRVRDRGVAFALAIEQHAAHAFTDARPTRLARQHDRAAKAADVVGEQRGLTALAGTVGSFDCYEQPVRHARPGGHP